MFKDRHIPVLTGEILSFAREALKNRPGGLIVDGTLGEAGHTLLFRKNFPAAAILSLDRDSEMILRASQRLTEEGFSPVISEEKRAVCLSGSIELVRSNFSDLAGILRESGLRPDFILLDLGISLYHYLGSGRGFSYTDESLDMRLDGDLGQSAAEIVNRYDEKKLAHLFKEYGEERYAGRAARAVVEARPIRDARELAAAVSRPILAAGRKHREEGVQRREKIHPAARVFQALRIEVNRELEVLQEALRTIPELLGDGGMLAVISFHSLEDRIVKERFRELGEKSRPDSDKKNRMYNKRVDSGKKFWIRTPKPIRPTEKECAENPASRSSRLRVLQKKLPS